MNKIHQIEVDSLSNLNLISDYLLVSTSIQC